MPTPGYVFRDGGPIPDSEIEHAHHEATGAPGDAHASAIHAQHAEQQASLESPNTSAPGAPPSNQDRKPTGLAEGPTDSHSLAAVDHDEKGAAQEEHFNADVKDLGWTDKDQAHSKKLIGGMTNEELWLLIRRFNKQIYHVKATNEPILAGLDLNIVDEDEFSPDKLRANVERLYMTVIVGLISFGKHIARLRSWREPRRTAAFAVAYALAWLFDFLVPTIFATLTLLIMFPRLRTLMFPPAPLALVDSKSGAVKTPSSGVLGSHDSVTGAPEHYQGEAVEQEASNFVAGIGTIALSSATGKHDADEASDKPGSDPISQSVPDPTNIAQAATDAKDFAKGEEKSHAHDKTKQPMQDAMWSQMRPVMHVIGDIADGWERFGNALSPTSPFSRTKPKLKLASLVAPGAAIALVTSSYMFTKMSMLVIGFVFFGDPILRRGMEFINEKVPNWQKYLELRNTLLKGIPTNAQLTVTLLRIGEANKAPLPPPPKGDAPPPQEAADLDIDEMDIGASQEEIQDAIQADETTDNDNDNDKPTKKKGSKILGLFKGTTKVGVETRVGSDNIRAVIGSKHAKDHLGAIPKRGRGIISGPIDFKARHKGKRGWVYINTSATIPCVGFSTHQSKGTGEDTEKELQPIFSIPIEDIRGLKKIGGYGWKAKLIVGWATDKNVVDGLEIVDKTGTSTKITAVVLRNELFNRLVAMGGQKWECW